MPTKAPPKLADWMEMDLSASVRENRLVPVWEVDDILIQIGDVVSGEGIRCPVLTGPSGVGKTATIHELVRRLARGEGPERLRGARVVQISLRTIAGRFKQPSDGAEIVRQLFDGIVTAVPPVIPYIRDLDTAYTLDWETLIVRFCAQARLPFLGEARARELAVMLEFTSDLSQYIIPIPVEEPDAGKTRRIVANWSESAATTGGRVITPDAQRIAIELTGRFLGNQHFPRKALDLLRQTRDIGVGAVTLSDVVARFSQLTRVPQQLVDPEIRLDLNEVRTFLAERLLGQEESVDAVIRMIALIKAGLADSRRPFGAFLFVGPTGVGKTHTGQLLAEYLFGDRHRLVRVNMADYAGEADAAVLFGNPLGRTLDEKRGVIATRLGGVAFGVLLLDEFEKAHTKVHDAFLQLMDEGRYINGMGETVSARSLIVIATSNAGAEVYRESGIGFRDSTDVDRADAELDRRLLKHFRLEFLNRFDRVVHFHPLDRATIRAIATRELSELLRREGIAGRGLAVDVDAEVLDWLVAHGYHPHYGARFLRREIERSITGTLAQWIVNNNPPTGTRIALGVRRDAIIVRMDEPSVELPPRRVIVDAFASARDWVERWTSRELEANARKEAASALIAQSAAADFWSDPGHAQSILREYTSIDARIQADARLLTPARRLARLVGHEEVEVVAELLAEAEAAWTRWSRLEADGGPIGAWLIVGTADALATASSPWLVDLVEMERAWLARLGFTAEIVAERIVSERVAGVAIEVEGAGVIARLAMECGIHRRRARNGHIERLLVEVVPRGEARSGPPVHDARRVKGAFVERRACRVVVAVAGKGSEETWVGIARDTLALFGADVLAARKAGVSEVEVARQYGFDGVAARDPRTGAVVVGGKEATRGEFEGLLRAWEERGS